MSKKSQTQKSQTENSQTQKSNHLTQSTPPAPLQSTLDRIEHTVGRLGERLTPELSPGQQTNIAGMLRELLDSRIETNSSHPTLNSHFKELFTGLGAIEQSASRHQLAALSDAERIKQTLRAGHSEQAILDEFKEAYYHGVVSYKYTVAVLKDARVTKIEHLLYLVQSGGTLIKWSQADKHFFELHVANKYWRLGDRARARALVQDFYYKYGQAELLQDSLSLTRLQVFVRALVATQPQLATASACELAEAQCARPLFVMWTAAVAFKRPELAQQLARALNSPTGDALAIIADAKLTSAPGIDIAPLLSLTPRRHGFEQQLVAAVLAIASAEPELGRPLAALLGEMQSSDIVEARIAAFRLSLE